MTGWEMTGWEQGEGTGEYQGMMKKTAAVCNFFICT